MRSIMVSVLLAGVAAVALTAGASAQGRKRVHVIEAYDTSSLNALTVNRRSWLDSGNTVHSGSVNGGQSYVSASTIYNRTPDKAFAPDGFGNDVINGQPYIPGPSHPVVEFSSAPNGLPVVENVLGEQNYYFNPTPRTRRAKPQSSIRSRHGSPLCPNRSFRATGRHEAPCLL